MPGCTSHKATILGFSFQSLFGVIFVFCGRTAIHSEMHPVYGDIGVRSLFVVKKVSLDLAALLF